MNRLTLTQTVELTGRDIFGRKSRIVFSPTLPGTGWVWRVNSKDIPITPDIMVSKPRRVALVHGDHEFNEFEHIGILRAAGLHDVRIYSEKKKTWPPFDGSSFALWQTVMPHVKKDGVLKPYAPLVERGGLRHGFSHRKNDHRWTTFSSNSNAESKKQLELTGVIDFVRFGGVMRGSYTSGDDLRLLTRARTLGWPPILAQTAGWLAHIISYATRYVGWDWPHYGSIIWPLSAHPPALLDETMRHRLLDALAILNFAAPTGSYLVGSFHSKQGSHHTDLGLLQYLQKEKVAVLAHESVVA